MSIFLVVFYSLKDEEDDLAGLFVADSVSDAAIFAESTLYTFLAPRFQSSASFVFRMGCAFHNQEYGMIAGPFYGKFFNRHGCESWIREAHDYEWEQQFED